MLLLGRLGEEMKQRRRGGWVDDESEACDVQVHLVLAETTRVISVDPPSSHG